MSDTEKEYILFCDESIKDGTYYSNFYGAALVGAKDYQSATDRLNAIKLAENLYNEVKWQRVTATYLAKYIRLIDAFFDELDAGRVKVRIMFKQNARKPRGLTSMQVEQGFYILYYQFIKHGIGFADMPEHDQPVKLRLYFDQFPDTGEQVARFRGYLMGLNRSPVFLFSKLSVQTEDLAEVDSKHHVLLQCLDIVLGGMAFRLNDMHLIKPEGESKRGSRTIAKEKLYKHILGRIRKGHPNFNIGISTGSRSGNRWESPYLHWLFVPGDHEYDETLTKRKKP